jgi:hypothetical protein
MGKLEFKAGRDGMGHPNRESTAGKRKMAKLFILRTYIYWGTR